MHVNSSQTFCAHDDDQERHFKHLEQLLPHTATCKNVKQT